MLFTHSNSEWARDGIGMIYNNLEYTNESQLNFQLIFLQLTYKIPPPTSVSNFGDFLMVEKC